MEAKNRRSKQEMWIIVGMIVVALVIAIVSYIIGFNNGKSSVTNEVQNNSQGQSDIGKLEELEDGFSIDTPYGAIYYPLEWKNQIRTEAVKQEESYIVEFYGTVEGREEIHLFDIVFNGTNGYNIGQLTLDKGETVAVNIVSYNFGEKGEWRDDEYFSYCAMQQDVNYIIQALRLNENFKESM